MSLYYGIFQRSLFINFKKMNISNTINKPNAFWYKKRCSHLEDRRFDNCGSEIDEGFHAIYISR